LTPRVDWKCNTGICETELRNWKTKDWYMRDEIH